MKSIFAKTLAAAAIAGVCSANAATITALSSNSTYTENLWPLVSLEGVNLFSTPGLSIGTGDSDVAVSVTTAADYPLGATITVTITGADVADTSAPTFNNANVAFLSASTVGDQNDSLTFLVTTDEGLASGAELVLSGVDLLLTADADAVVAVEVAAATNGGESLDSAASTNVAQVSSEVAVTVGTALGSATDGAISVANDRLAFVNGSTDDSFTLNVDTGADIFAVTAEKATIALSGTDLSFMQGAGGMLDSNAYSVSTNGTVGAEDQSLNDAATTFEATTAADVTTTNSDDVTVRIGAATGNALVAQTFTADVDLGYSLGATEGTFSADGLAAGAWSLSGTTFNIPYMPYGSNISQIVYVSNSGSIDANVELTAFDDEGNTYGPVTLDVQARSGRVTSLSTAIKTALQSDDDFDGSGKFDISLTINASTGDLDLFSAYNAGGDRLDAPNSVVSTN